jgi:tRNA threonylcarbamoyladenosine biosynthesis protein TsaE
LDHADTSYNVSTQTSPVHRINSHSAAQTQCLGQCLGELLERRLVIRLMGDLGAGKTCFVQGLARGLEVPEAYAITSPTYSLIHEYPSAHLPLYHVDLYRLHSTLDMDAIGLWDVLDQDAVIAVEWPDRLDDTDWPADSLCIQFHIRSDTARELRLFGCGLQMDNLIEGVVAAFAGQCANSLK